jgi:hypothetical protein
MQLVNLSTYFNKDLLSSLFLSEQLLNKHRRQASRYYFDIDWSTANLSFVLNDLNISYWTIVEDKRKISEWTMASAQNDCMQDICQWKKSCDTPSLTCSATHQLFIRKISYMSQWTTHNFQHTSVNYALTYRSTMNDFYAFDLLGFVQYMLTFWLHVVKYFLCYEQDQVNMLRDDLWSTSTLPRTFEYVNRLEWFTFSRRVFILASYKSLSSKKIGLAIQYLRSCFIFDDNTK